MCDIMFSIFLLLLFLPVCVCVCVFTLSHSLYLLILCIIPINDQWRDEGPCLKGEREQMEKAQRIIKSELRRACVYVRACVCR